MPDPRDPFKIQMFQEGENLVPEVEPVPKIHIHLRPAMPHEVQSIHRVAFANQLPENGQICPGGESGSMERDQRDAAKVGLV